MSAPVTEVVQRCGWPVVERPPALRSNEPHVWLIDLRDGCGDARSLEVLDAAERARAARLADRRTRDQWVRSRAALRMILGSYLKIEAPSVGLLADARGRPRLADGQSRDVAPAFSLSHSEDAALVAVARDTPLGVDLEFVRPFPEMSMVVAQYCSDAEQAELAALEPSDAVAGFYRCWTRKEAVLKALGIGLNASLAALTVECALTARPRVREIASEFPPASTWKLHHLQPCDGYVAALATTESVRRVRMMRFSG